MPLSSAQHSTRTAAAISGELKTAARRVWKSRKKQWKLNLTYLTRKKIRGQALAGVAAQTRAVTSPYPFLAVVAETQAVSSLFLDHPNAD